MRIKLNIILLLVVLFISLISVHAYAQQCQVEKVLGVKVETGLYKINVTRDSQDLYKVTGQNIYIKTLYCYEYVYSQDAILEITSLYGYSIGEIYFK